MKKWPKYSNRHFSKECLQIANKQVKRHSTSLTFRKTQTKTMVRYCFTHLGVIIPKKMQKNPYWQGNRERGSLIHCCKECKIFRPLYKTIYLFRLLNIYLPCGYITLIHSRSRNMIGNFFLPFCGLSFHFIDSVQQSKKVFNPEM